MTMNELSVPCNVFHILLGFHHAKYTITIIATHFPQDGLYSDTTPTTTHIFHFRFFRRIFILSSCLGFPISSWMDILGHLMQLPAGTAKLIYHYPIRKFHEVSFIAGDEKH